jgi:histidinol-phosphate aminotransferase
VDLRHHGDQDAAPGLVDLAVNVRTGPRPCWLDDAVAGADLTHYPDPSGATAALARQHGRTVPEVLVTSGAAEAFVLLARALQPQHAVALHPSFTEPEAALRAAGHKVHRALAVGPSWQLPEVADEADLVVLGNPTNPTGVLHPRESVRALARPGRVLVVDEAFMDFVPGETESLTGCADVPGLVVVRSLTKMWGLAGLRVGYLLAEPRLVERLREHQPLWSVSAPALAAAEACASPLAREAAAVVAVRSAADREAFAAALSSVPGVSVSAGAAANFVLVRVPAGAVVRNTLRDKGFAVRRGDTFPGLGPDWLRLTVPGSADVARAFVTALRGSLTEG